MRFHAVVDVEPRVNSYATSQRTVGKGPSPAGEVGTALVVLFVMAPSTTDLCFCSPLELHECALCHLRRGEYREALAPLARLIMVGGIDGADAAVLWATLAHIYNGLGRPEQAASAARRALKLRPGFVQAREELARAAVPLPAGDC